jgi:hypothetical protein
MAFDSAISLKKFFFLKSHLSPQNMNSVDVRTFYIITESRELQEL